MERKPRGVQAHKRNDGQRAADELLVEYYVVRGYSAARIKAVIAANRPYTISGTQIQNDMNKIKQRWREDAKAEIQSFVDAELAGLKKQEDELWAAWERSQKDAESETRETVISKGGKTPTGRKRKGKNLERVTKSRTGQVGGVQFQNAILQIREQRRSLLGLDQPRKIASTTVDGKNLAPLVLCVSPEELPTAKKS